MKIKRLENKRQGIRTVVSELPDINDPDAIQYYEDHDRDYNFELPGIDLGELGVNGKVEEIPDFTPSHRPQRDVRYSHLPGGIGTPREGRHLQAKSRISSTVNEALKVGDPLSFIRATYGQSVVDMMGVSRVGLSDGQLPLFNPKNEGSDQVFAQEIARSYLEKSRVPELLETANSGNHGELPVLVEGYDVNNAAIEKQNALAAQAFEALCCFQTFREWAWEGDEDFIFKESQIKDRYTLKEMEDGEIFSLKTPGGKVDAIAFKFIPPYDQDADLNHRLSLINLKKNSAEEIIQKVIETLGDDWRKKIERITLVEMKFGDRKGFGKSAQIKNMKQINAYLSILVENLRDLGIEMESEERGGVEGKTCKLIGLLAYFSPDKDVDEEVFKPLPLEDPSIEKTRALIENKNRRRIAEAWEGELSRRLEKKGDKWLEEIKNIKTRMTWGEIDLMDLVILAKSGVAYFDETSNCIVLCRENPISFLVTISLWEGGEGLMHTGVISHAFQKELMADAINDLFGRINDVRAETRAPGINDFPFRIVNGYSESKEVTKEVLLKIIQMYL